LAGSSGAGWLAFAAIFDHGGPEKVRNADTEPLGDEMEDLDGGIGRTAFEVAHVGPVHADRKAESLLG
jgi:hypothetical protein